MNERYPRINPELMRIVLKETGLSGTFTTREEILTALALIRQKLYGRFDAKIRTYERYALLTDALNMLDLLYMNYEIKTYQRANAARLSHHEYAVRNIPLERYVGMLGKALERVSECALSYDAFSKSIVASKQGIMPLLELGVEIVVVNQTIEDLVDIWHRGRLVIDQNDWQWELPSDDEDRYKGLIMKKTLTDVEHERSVLGSNNASLTYEDYIDSLKKLGQQSEVTGSSKLGYDDEEFIVTINSIHQEIFGYKYSEKLECMLALAGFPKKLDRDWIFEDEIGDFLHESLGFSNEVSMSVLHSLCLEGSLIKGENRQPLEFRRMFRLIRRPLPRVRVGYRYVYYVSVPFLFRGFRQIQAEYFSGTYPELQGTDVQKRISRLNQRYADYFVKERMFPIFKRSSFAADSHVQSIGGFDLNRECGEIDILAFNYAGKELIVAECKHRVTGHSHVSEIRNEVYRFTRPGGFVDQLRRKVDWVENHKRDVLEYLKIRGFSSESIKCVPTFVTNYHCPASEFVSGITFLAESELNHWCAERTRGVPDDFA